MSLHILSIIIRRLIGLSVALLRYLTESLISFVRRMTGSLVGRRIRVVEMDGCMAHIEGDERWGTIQRVEKLSLIGAYEPTPMALVRYDDGREDWQPTAPNELYDRGTHLERRI